MPEKRQIDASPVGAAASPAKVLARLRKQARRHPLDAEVHGRLAEALAQEGHVPEAISSFQEAIRLSPGEAAYHYRLGTLLWEQGRHEQAVTALGEAVRLRPRDVLALEALAVGLAEAGRESQAAEILQQALRLDRSRVELYANLGRVLTRLGRHAEAEDAFRRAVRLAPGSAEVHRSLGWALLAAGRGEEGLAALRESVRLRPDDAGRHLDLAEALQAQGLVEPAHAAFEEALRLDPDCLEGRPASREARDANSLARLRSELRAERGAPPAMVKPWSLLLSAASALRPATSWLGGARSLVPLGMLLAAAYGAWLLLPPYLGNALLRDAMVDAARTPVTDDAFVLERLMHAVREQHLEGYVGEASFAIESRPRWRVITCDYVRPIAVLPGFRPLLRLHIRVEEPYIVLDEAPVFF